MGGTGIKPSERRRLAEIQAELSRVIRYDDESIVNDRWVRQRYDCGCFPSLMPARKAAVVTAWHEAGHAVAALNAMLVYAQELQADRGEGLPFRAGE